jgi:hypothetical protein
MDAFAWLRELDLGQYEDAFRDNAIEERVLPGLTSDDLKEIGVGPVGHRRRILDAIAALRSRTESPEAVGPKNTRLSRCPDGHAPQQTRRGSVRRGAESIRNVRSQVMNGPVRLPHEE